MSPILDSEALIPILRPRMFVDGDKDRSRVTFTSVLTINGVERKSKFSVPVFSNTVNEDIESLIVTIQGFQIYAATEGLWDVGPSVPVPLLFMEWPKCLTGTALQDWIEVQNRLAGIVNNWRMFKVCLSEFIVIKICGNPDAYEHQHDYLRERHVPETMYYNDYYKRLILINEASKWLLTPEAITRVYRERVPGATDAERLEYGIRLLWTLGTKTDDQVKDIVLRTAKVGDRVLLLNKPLDPKLKPHAGPYKVVSYDQSTGTLNIKRGRYVEPINIRLVRPYFGRS